MLVNLSGRDIVFTSQGNIQISLVIAKIKVDFSAVIEYKAFAMSVIVVSVTDRTIAASRLKYSRGFISPASIFIYGSIFIEVTTMLYQRQIILTRPFGEDYL